MNPRPKIGIVTLIFGAERYYLNAEVLALSARLHMPGLPVALVTDRPERADRSLFDFVVPLDGSRGLSVGQKIFIDEYSPFETSLYIDADCVVTRPFDRELAELDRHSFTPVCEYYLKPEDSDIWVADLAKALALCGGRVYPKFNGGFLFFKRDEPARQVFARAREILADYERYGLKRFDRISPSDESVFALAMVSAGLTELYDDGGNFMRPTIDHSRFSIDPLRGLCAFRAYGRELRPAICHFVRNNVFSRQYLSSEWKLRRNAGRLAGPRACLSFLGRGCLRFALFEAKRLYAALRTQKARLTRKGAR